MNFHSRPYRCFC